MSKLLDFSEFFVFLNNNGVPNFTPVILITIVIAVGSVIALFLYSFNRQETPKFRQSTSGTNSNLKRKKRPASSNASSNTVQTIQSQVEPLRERATTKKDVVNSNSHASVSTKKQKSIKPAPKTAKATPKNVIKEKQTVPQKTILNSNDDEGEWKTVTTKKQRKQPSAPIPDLLIQAVAEVAAVASKKTNANNAKNTNSRTSIEKSKDNVNNDKENQTMVTLQHKENIVLPTTTIVSPVAYTPPVSLTADVAIVAAKDGVNAAASGLNNIVFDELGDNSWTENKPQRKNKKRAVRE